MTDANNSGPTSDPAVDDAVAELAALQALDGLDVAVGLAAVGGRLPIYRRLLARFVQTHEIDVTRWEALLDAGRSQEARQQVHAVRGAASTLGLIAIDEAARVLEAALVGGVEAGRLSALSAELGRVIAESVAALRSLQSIRQALDDLAATR